MSIDFRAALQAELSSPDVKAEMAKAGSGFVGGVVFLEDLFLRTAMRAFEAALPPVVRQLVELIAEPFINRGITALENLTEEEGRKLFPMSAKATIGTQTLALTVAKVFPADLPQSPFESLPDGGGADRNQE